MTLPIATGKWVIDPTHSSIGFIAKHLGFTKVRGSFEEYSLEVNVGDTLENSSVSTTVNLNSVNTSNADRDEHLKGCLLYTSPSPRDRTRSRMPSSA